MIFSNKLFCQFYLQTGEIVNHTTLVMLSEKLLKLGTANEIVTAYRFNGEMLTNMLFQISSNFVV